MLQRTDKLKEMEEYKAVRIKKDLNEEDSTIERVMSWNEGEKWKENRGKEEILLANKRREDKEMVPGERALEKT